MAKMIKFNLTLNGATVSTLQQLQDSFSADILPIYRAGRLLKWLQARDLTEEAQALQAITPSDDDREQLGALCRALGLDDDADTLTFLLEDWQARQERQTTAQATPADSNAEDSETEADTAPATAAVDWSGQDMRGRNFEGADLRNGNFKGTNFSNCNFEGADLRNGNFEETNFANCKLSGADFTGANLTKAKLQNAYGAKANFNSAILELADMIGCAFINCDFSNSKIQFYLKTNRDDTKPVLKFLNCDFSNCDFLNCSFLNYFIYIINISVKMFACDLEGANLSFCNVAKECFPEMDCNFKNANVLGIQGLGKSDMEEMTKRFLEKQNNN